MLKLYADLTKLGIVIFVVLAGLAGYVTSFGSEQEFSWLHLLQTLGGLFLLSSGSLALNQLQEHKIDSQMNRTAKRPIAAGKIKPAAAGVLALALLVAGSDLLWKVSQLAWLLGWSTVILYNGLYTYWWKRKWVFAAIPGALPGALPVTIGYAANSEQIFAMDSVYLFMILFLWQMPHFWTLAIRYREDYSKGGVPVMPAVLGVHRTFMHMGIYTFLYALFALAAPLFVRTSWLYLALVLPFVFKVVQEFFRFFSSKDNSRWLPFFLWTNVSVLIFLFVPAIDKWNFLFTKTN